MKNNYLITIILVIVFAVVGFIAGMKYQGSKVSSTSFSGRFGGANGTGTRRGGAGMGQVVGEILSADNGSITVKLQDGSSKIVLFSDKVTINKATQGSISDLTTGTKVGVFGTTNSDGSVTAQNIQINPVARGGAAPKQ